MSYYDLQMSLEEIDALIEMDNMEREYEKRAKKKSKKKSQSVSQEIIDDAREHLWMIIEDHGYRCEDGHWLTEKEFYVWEDDRVLREYENVFGMRKLNTRLRRRTVAFAVLFLCAVARSSDGGGWRNRSFRRDLTLQDRKKSLPQTKNMLQPSTTFLQLCCNFAHARALTGYTVM